MVGCGKVMREPPSLRRNAQAAFMNVACLVDSMHKLQSPEVQTASLNISSRIFSIARDGAKPLGQTSVQFMIVRQRNSR
jgi:hypothetical protein